MFRKNSKKNYYLCGVGELEWGDSEGPGCGVVLPDISGAWMEGEGIGDLVERGAVLGEGKGDLVHSGVALPDKIIFFVG